MGASEANDAPRDWRSYDVIADRYDTHWSARFEAVTRHMWTLSPPRAGDRLLDVGAGTGIVLRTCHALGRQPALAVAADLSLGMLSEARRRTPGIVLIVADACALPLSSLTFDVATASFVLSHVPDYRAALSEMHRVLKVNGRLIVTNWAPLDDPYSSLWNESLAALISKQAVNLATREVTPWEEHFSQPGRLESAVSEAGLRVISSATPPIEYDLTVEQFIQDREISATSRLATDLIGMEAWAQFRAQTSRLFHERFGPRFTYARRAIIVVGRKE